MPDRLHRAVAQPALFALPENVGRNIAPNLIALPRRYFFATTRNTVGFTENLSPRAMASSAWILR